MWCRSCELRAASCKLQSHKKVEPRTCGVHPASCELQGKLRACEQQKSRASDLCRMTPGSSYSVSVVACPRSSAPEPRSEGRPPPTRCSCCQASFCTGPRLDFSAARKLAACLAARSSQDGPHRCEARLFCDFAACSLQLAARRIDTTRKSPGQRNLTFCEQLSVLCTTTSAHGPNLQAAKAKVQGASCSTTNSLNSHLPLARFRVAAKCCLC